LHCRFGGGSFELASNNRSCAITLCKKRKRKGDGMIKSLTIIIGGIFVGAVGMEIIHRKFPKKMNKFYKKTRSITSAAKEACSDAKEAFKAGYKNVTTPGKAAASGA
jgi:hypothetical protein